MRDHLEGFEAWDWDAAVIGLGYVGLPLVVTLARAGIRVTGFDIDPRVIEDLRCGRSHVDDVTDEELGELAQLLSFSNDPRDLVAPDVLFICVPTPLSVGKQPDMSFIEKAGETVAGVLRRGHLIVLESTTYPGTTDQVLLPMFLSTGLKLDEDFLLAYAPERIDPRNVAFNTGNIPRVVGGVSPRSCDAAVAVYRRFVQKVHPVSSARAAEMAKLLENTFRWVNIALVNEMAQVCHGLGIDVWEVVEAAASKPFGFMPFHPGPGVGGHCIPLDPFYLRYVARLNGQAARFVELAEIINTNMPQVVVDRMTECLDRSGRGLGTAKILVLGVAYKPNVRDCRESPALEVIRLLREAGAATSYCDPLVPCLEAEGMRMTSVELTPERLREADCVVILADHDCFDYQLIASESRLIFDSTNAIRRRRLTTPNLSVL